MNWTISNQIVTLQSLNQIPQSPITKSSMSSSLNPHRIVNLKDLSPLARRRLPRVVFDYIDGVADRETTLRDNCRAFDELGFRPRCAVATPAPKLRTMVLGTPLSLPLLLAPVGSSRMFHPRGEEAAA